MPRETKPDSASDRPLQDSGLVQRFHDLRPLYDKLADEVAFSLEKRLGQQKIPFAHVTKRTKNLDSFFEKLDRKHYDDPWKEVTDLAGVRVVFLYPSARSRIESLIEKEFRIVEKVDKTANLGEDQFGYGALHYIVGLSDATSGARYEDLKHLVCEIQVRTVMQDAWALIDHHLVYKNEASIPSRFKRRLNTIAGMFENIDEQFDRMRVEREAYVKEVKEQSKVEETFLQQEVNFETVSAYLSKEFPDLPSSPNHINQILRNTRPYGLRTLQDIQMALNRTKRARQAISKVVPAKAGIAEIARAVALLHPAYRDAGWSTERKKHFAQYAHLVEQG